MPDRRRPLLAIGLVVGMTAATIVTCYGAIQAANQSTPSHEPRIAGATKTCTSRKPVAHRVIIQNNQVEPRITAAALCDTLTITNLDAEDRLMAFGLHDSHEPYDGIEERALSKGQSLTITLVEVGKFRFHDHSHDEVEGTFTVSKNNL